MKKIVNVLLTLLVLMTVIPIVSAEEVSCQNQLINCIEKPKIDVVFVIDSTGSMADEIRTVKTHLTKIIKEVQSGQPTPDLRVGIVAYRDHSLEEQEYLYKRFDLTSNIDNAVNFIWNIKAEGGGDLPEAVADGLDIAINRMSWKNQQTNAKKLIFLIGDAAPHGEGSTDSSYQQGCPEGHNYRENIEDAKEKGIRIYTVSGSGIDTIGIRAFKEIASKTGGSYTKLSYVRQEVEQYYQDEGFTEEEVQVYAREATNDADYDKSTNTILTNTLGKFALGSMKAEAADIGVKYEKPVEEHPEQEEKWIDVETITGDSGTEEPIEENSFSDFLRTIFGKLVFWK